MSSRPLSHAQRRLLLLERLGANPDAARVARAVILDATPAPAIRTALERLVRAHPILNGEVLADGWREAEGPTPFHHEAAEEDEGLATLRRAMADHSVAGRPRLAAFVVTEPTKTFVGLLSHQVVANDHTLEQVVASLVRELGREVDGLREVRSWAFEAPSEEARGAAAAALASRALHSLEVPELGGDKVRPAVQSLRCTPFSRPLFFAASDAARALARELQVATESVYLAATALVLSRYLRSREVLIAYAHDGDAWGPTTRRDLARLALAPETSVRALVAAAEEERTRAVDVGFEELLDRLAPPRDPSRAPITQLAFAYRARPSGDFTWTDVPRLASPFDLEVVVAESGPGAWVTVLHSDDLFDDFGRGPRLIGHLEETLQAMREYPSRTLASIDIVSAAERQYLSVGVNPSASFPSEDTLVSRIAARATAQPDAVAVRFEKTSLSFAELERESDRVARSLAALGVGREDRVALRMERSASLIVALLGILKAGAAYVPIEPSQPAERAAFVLEDAAPKVLIVDDQDHSPPVSGVVLVRRIAELTRDTSGIPEAPLASSLAYVIYTSGSTGRPKGCLIEHRHVVRLLDATAEWFSFGPDDVWTMFHSVAFDFSVWEIWAALATGGRVVVVPHLTTRSPAAFRQLVAEEGVTVLNQTPSAFRHFIDADGRAKGRLTALRTVIFGGEALELSSLRPWFDRYGDSAPRLVNMYGITETTVHVTYRPLRLADLEAGYASVIGVPIPDLRVYVVDQDDHLAPIGVAGELLVGGAGVARGYHARPELTRQRFVEDRYGGSGALYRSGDLAKRLPSGELDYLGRIDQQVKIRGFRIETGEIEACLRRLGLVRDVTVVPVNKAGAETVLVAYVVSDKTPAELRAALRSALPEYMIPSAFVGLDDIPMTQNGKVDRRALPDAWASDQGAGEVLAEPRGDLERGIASVFAEVLRRSVGADTHFFDAGGSSLDAVVAADRIGARFGVEVPVIKLFEHTTVEALARWLADALPTEVDAHAGPGVSAGSGERAAAIESPLHEPIAIIGFAGRFPGADSVTELWENLLAGKDAVTRFDKADLDPSLDPAVVARPDYVAARGVLRAPELFDAAFFGMSPKEADVTDPQQRLALELSWDALESAGYDPARFGGSIGVFAGEYNVTYYTENVLRRPEVVDAVGAFAAMVGNEKDFIATRVAFKLDLRGPALSIHTACSTSLVAVAHAVSALRLGDCDMALAGGAAVTCPPRSGYVYQPGSMLSPDGFTRTFDARAEGTVFSDGAAFVVLRRLRDALRDGDRVIAVIRGAATNNDGGDKMSFTAPSAAGQAAVIKRALANAEVDPATIGYVEAHGTATPLGDPIEIDGLARAFGAHPKPGSIAIGSLKSNVGHMVAAAGAAGLIKAALAVKEGRIPPTIHFESANPKLGLSRSAFYVADRLIEWRSASGAPRRAGVSSFGVGGTNAHVVLEEAPPAPPTSPSRRSAQLFLLSARSPEALGRRAADLRLALERGGASAADVAFTLAQGRRAFASRHFVVAADVAAAAAALAKPASAIGARVRPTLAFAFTGQGSQYVAMGRALSREEPVFAEALTRCSNILAGWGCDLGAVLDPGEHDREGAEAKLRETAFTQPALFAVEWALYQLWRSLGVEPQILMGHSVGEFVAACVAGVFSLEDALKLVLARGRLMQAAPPGVMLSVRAAHDEVAPLISGQLGIAVVNAPKLCVVGGPEPEIAALEAKLAEREIATSRLRTSHAFHSPSMDGAVAPFLEVVRGVQLSPPTVPILSTVTTRELTPEQATDPMYWARHLRAPVMFGPALAALWRARPDALVLEVGPRATLATLGKQIASDPRRQVAVATLDVGGSLPTAADPPEGAAFLRALGQLWAHGAPVDWTAYFAGEARARVELPGYPFERRRHWVDPPRAEAPRARPAAEPPPLATAIAATSAPASVAIQPPAPLPTDSTPKAPMTTAAQDRRPAIAAAVRAVFEEASGVDLDGAPPSTSFMELGLDSLSLTQCAQLLGKRVGGGVTFRELVEELGSLELLVARLDEALPAEAMRAAAPAPVAPAAPTSAPANGVAMALPAVPFDAALTAGSPDAVRIVSQQLELMARQIDLLRGLPAPSAQGLPVVPALAPTPAALTNGAAAPQSAAAPEEPATKKTFGAGARIDRTVTKLSPKDEAALAAFYARYIAKTKGSKRYTEEHRGVLADPRVVTGFKPMWKEIVYPLVVERSEGAHLWDIDGNDFIDVTCGFGANFLGHRPPYVVEAVNKQLAAGFEIGPQHPLAGECAKLVSALTGLPRVVFSNTGSEAVLGATRLARAVSGRPLIVSFTGDYHGILDEVIVRGTKSRRSIPGAPGILPSSVENNLVLDYGEEASLELIAARAGEIAAVLVEPVQSRRPDLQPREFLKKLRELTEREGIALIFDEIITGFRLCPGGAQEYFGVRADLATYGKILGGGLPIGAIAGIPKYMDALDGGAWSYGDASVPEVGVTYFAGTFVRHPLALAACKASLTHLIERGPALQQAVNERTRRLVDELSQFMTKVGAPFELTSCSSWFKLSYPDELPFAGLIFFWLRSKGIHIWDGRVAFLTTAHTDADCEAIKRAFMESVREMQDAGLIEKAKELDPFASPPVPGARLGKNRDGSPGWFVPDPDRPGKYLLYSPGASS